MTESSTPEGTGGTTVEQAAERFASMLSQDREESTGGETGDEQSQTAPDDEPDDADQADEGADGAEQSDEDAEDEDASEGQPQTLTVKIDGKDVAVTVDELTAGYSRTADYTRKTQALAEERKALDAERQGLSQEREQAKMVLEHWEQQLSTPLYDPAETEALRYTDPAEWAARKQEEADRVAQLQGISARKTQIATQETAEQKAAHQRAVAETEQRLYDAIPEWKANPETAKKGLDEIWAYAGTHGFTPQDILADPDHRALLILRDAAAYQAIKSKRAAVEKTVAAIKTAAPGNAKGLPSKVTEVTRARQRLAKTHSVDDAAAIFSHMRPPT